MTACDAAEYPTAMENCTIRPVDPSEVEALAELARRTFAAAFASGNAPDDLAAYVERAFAVERMAAELAAPDSHFLFAEVEGELAGYLKINTGDAQTEQVDGETLEVERIYVDARQQGRGVGKALLDFSLEEARRRGCDTVWLGVWESNAKAIAFYERQDFVPFGKHDFTVGTDVQTDILMRCALR